MTTDHAAGAAADPEFTASPRERSLRIQASIGGLAPYVTAMLATLWVFRRALFDGELPGNVGDARWTVALFEHWHRVWSGDAAIRDVDFFFPERRTLGTSDPFFFQGQVHALARTLGADVLDAWLLALVVTFVVGAVGVACLARRVLVSPWSQVGIVAVTCVSYPILVRFGHVQNHAFLCVAWLFVGIHSIHADETERGVRLGLAILLVVPPLLAISGFYAFALGLMTMVVLGLFVALLTDRRVIGATIRHDAGRVWLAFKTPVGAVTVVVAVVLWAFAAWIFLPARDLLPEPPWAEVTVHSPRWLDTVNAAAGGGGVWSPLYDRVFGTPAPNTEQATGFTPILLVSLVVVGLSSLRKLALGDAYTRASDALPGRRGLLAAWLTVFALVGLFLVDERGFSVFRLLWDHLPGLEAIRAPFRVQLLLYPLGAYVVLRGIELWCEERRDSGNGTRRLRSSGLWTAILAGVVSLALLIEMNRPADSAWRRGDLLDSSLTAHVREVEDRCDSFILTEASRSDPIWLQPINAVILSMLSGVPTPQGYSRALPLGHPGLGADVRRLTQWMRAEGFSGSICTVSNAGVRIGR